MFPWKMKEIFPPLSQNSFCKHYYPMSGAVCHGILGVTITNPDLLSRLFPRVDWAVSNAIFANVMLGSGVYAYHRNHMLRVHSTTRVIYCVFTACMFSYGSVMLWATTSIVCLPKNAIIRTLFALLTSATLLGVAKDYLTYVDKLAPDAEK